jgi:hypothetical protein
MRDLQNSVVLVIKAWTRLLSCFGNLLIALFKVGATACRTAHRRCIRQIALENAEEVSALHQSLILLDLFLKVIHCKIQSGHSFFIWCWLINCLRFFLLLFNLAGRLAHFVWAYWLLLCCRGPLWRREQLTSTWGCGVVRRGDSRIWRWSLDSRFLSCGVLYLGACSAMFRDGTIWWVVDRRRPMQSRLLRCWLLLFHDYDRLFLHYSEGLSILYSSIDELL